jgi:hypothetical protein
MQQYVPAPDQEEEKEPQEQEQEKEKEKEKPARVTPLLHHRRTKSSTEIDVDMAPSMVGMVTPGSSMSALMVGGGISPRSAKLGGHAAAAATKVDRPRSVSVAGGETNPPLVVYPGFEPPNPEEILARKFVEGPRSRVSSRRKHHAHGRIASRTHFAF